MIRIIPSSKKAAAGLMVSGLTILFALGPAHACAPLSDADVALSAGPDIASLYDAQSAAQTAGCSAIERQQIDRWLAVALFQKAARESQTLDEAEPLLKEALAIAGPWQVHAAMGDVARNRRDFVGAALQYQMALQDAYVLGDPASTYWELPPSAEDLETLRQKSDEMRLAASSFVSLPGRPACQVQSMGLWASEIVAPIRFVTADTTMTADGEAAADELYACLAALDPAKVRSITVIGHTDERGSQAYNQDLSIRRAERVKAYLKERGLGLSLQIEGRGETELFQPDSPVAYSQEERWQMSRRVEVDVQRIGD
ncbi:MAG: OmpA family protein [Pseudomonadota bacterium]